MSVPAYLMPLAHWMRGGFAAEPDDPRFAEKTAWSILRFLARESQRRGLPLILPPTEDGP